MDYKRKPLKNEILLIHFLLQKADIEMPKDWEKEFLVASMTDGDMGSLKLYFRHDFKQMEFGRPASDCYFFDEDGVKVVATLYLDKQDFPMELDIWKTDFTRLIEIPNKFENFT